MPYAFTEHGVAMLSSVLKSDRAVQMNIWIMRAFVRLRESIASHHELGDKIAALERKYQDHDGEIAAIFEAIQALLQPPAQTKRKIGFGTAGAEPATINKP